MNIGTLKKSSSIQKHIYDYRPAEKEGLILQVHHTVQINKKEQRIRFIHITFNDIGQLLGASDQAGNIFLVDFLNTKYWILPNLKSCSILKFSNYNNCELIVGTNTGKLCIINTNTGETTGELISHKEPVKEITFSSDFKCLTSTENEAILWNLKTNTKIQVLSVQTECKLKHVLFMPVSNNILACFNDDSVLIWKHNTFEVYKKIQSSLWNKNGIRSLAFTRFVAVNFTDKKVQHKCRILTQWGNLVQVCNTPWTLGVVLIAPSVQWMFQTLNCPMKFKFCTGNGIRYSLLVVVYTQAIFTIRFRNGRAMVLSGYSAKLTVYMLDTWSVAKTIILPDSIRAVKKIAFVPQLFDGGSNRILAILATSGVIYFYDMEENVIVNQIVAQQEIIKFDCSSNGKHIACVLALGEINIYGVTQLTSNLGGSDSSTYFSSKSTTFSATTRRSSSLLCLIQKQIKDVLDVDKLRSILKEFGQYPDSYRLKIWTQLLELPNNFQQYNAYIDHQSHATFENLLKQYPLENKLILKNLKKLLSNLVTWSPHFSQVSYLPVFVFPFVKVFQNEPILCFEAICTIILNWCQYWFEYFPLPPLNILAIIENVLQEHDLELLEHLTVNNITSQQYAWNLIEAAFSEVLPPNDWCRVWDHILTNEPAFFIIVPVAYNILNRKKLLAMNSQDKFDTFYHNHNIIDTKRLLSKTYNLLNNTRKENHPSRYLKQFKKLEADVYPIYNGFPKTLIDFDFNEIDNLKLEEELIQREEMELLQDIQDEKDNVLLLKKQEEEAERLKGLEVACKKRITEERDRVKEQRKRLVNLRKQLHHEELALLNKSRQTIIEKNSKDRQWALEKILSDIEQSRAAEELEVVKAESDLIKHYSELLHHKIYLEEALNADQQISESSTEHKILKRHQQKLSEELDKIKNESKSKVYLKHLNITTGLAAMDNLILRIEMELAKQIGGKYENIIKTTSNLKMVRLEKETKELETEVSKMLKLLADIKSQETKEKFSELCGTAIDRTGLLYPQDSHYSRQQKSHEFKEKVTNIGSFGDDLGKLRKLLTETRDGYMARPLSPSYVSISSAEVAVINADD